MPKNPNTDFIDLTGIVETPENKLLIALCKGFNSLKSDIVSMKQDITELKSDVAELKSDVAELKEDVALLKQDVAQLKIDVAELKTDVAQLKTDVAQLKTEVSQLKVAVAENTKSIQKNAYLIKRNYKLITCTSKENHALAKDVREIKDTLGRHGTTLKKIQDWQEKTRLDIADFKMQSFGLNKNIEELKERSQYMPTIYDSTDALMGEVKASREDRVFVNARIHRCEIRLSYLEGEDERNSRLLVKQS